MSKTVLKSIRFWGSFFNVQELILITVLQVKFTKGIIINSFRYKAGYYILYPAIIHNNIMHEIWRYLQRYS